MSKVISINEYKAKKGIKTNTDLPPKPLYNVDGHLCTEDDLVQIMVLQEELSKINCLLNILKQIEDTKGNEQPKV